MSMFLKRVGLVAVLTALVCVALAASAFANGRDRAPVPAITEPGHRSLLRIGPEGPFPVTRKVTLGVDKSMLIEVPMDLENVLVSNPEVVDAVVQTRRQVYLLAKDAGEANAFFIAPNGQKLLLLDVAVMRDLSTLTDALHRLLPGSKINAEAMGDNVVLTGSVVNPVDANRAAELAMRFIKKKADSVVNMLSVAPPAKEQVLLRVKVAEMQRDAIRRLGVNVPDWRRRLSGRHRQSTFFKILHNAFPVTSPTVPIGQAGSRNMS